MNDTQDRGERAILTAQQQTELEQLIAEWQMSDADAQTLRSLTRLLVGGALLGWDELRAHLRAWESEVDQQHPWQGETLWVELEEPNQVEPVEISRKQVRHTLLGLAFELQDRWVRRSRSAVSVAGRLTSTMASPVVGRIERNPRWRPLRNRYERLIEKGETVTQRWLDRGQYEEARSRRLVEIAVKRSFDTTMDELGNAPALEELVRKQSAGLGQTAIEEVRARTVSGDILAEHLVRSILRRKPRRELPPTQTQTEEADS